MTEQLFQTDSYLKEFSAVVTGVSIEENAVILDKTAFYPGGGGQPYDTGYFETGAGKLPVIKVKKQGGDILHRIDGELPEKGAVIKGAIDWDRRFKLMRTHSALHVLCGVIWRDYGAQVTGGNMEPLKARMDFEFETMHRELVDKISETLNYEIQQNRNILVKILPREEAFKIPDLIRTKINLLPEEITEVRTIEVAGLDLQADGGTHVSNTREIGKVKIVDYKSKGRINKRIFIEIVD